jgi:hypothetical protein
MVFRFPRPLLLGAALAVTIAACRRTGASPPAATGPVASGAVAAPAAVPAAPAPSDAPKLDERAMITPGLRQMDEGFSRPTRSALKSVAYEALEALLPAAAGWTQSDLRGEQLAMPVSYSRAEARYHGAAGEIAVEIMDTAMNDLLLAPLSMFSAAGYSERSDAGFTRAARIGGQPGAEEWNSRTQRAEVTAIVHDRFVVRGVGQHVKDIAAVRALVEMVDVGRLAALR